MLLLLTLPLLFTLQRVPDLCNCTYRHDAGKTSFVSCDVHLLSFNLFWYCHFKRLHYPCQYIYRYFSVFFNNFRTIIILLYNFRCPIIIKHITFCIYSIYVLLWNMMFYTAIFFYIIIIIAFIYPIIQERTNRIIFFFKINFNF